MNKSKFLKRSLATLLAILMVVAMVPMSAFAAVVIAEDVPTARSIEDPGYKFALNGVDFVWDSTLGEEGGYKADYLFTNDGQGTIPKVQLSMMQTEAAKDVTFVLTDTNTTLTFSNTLVDLKSAGTKPASTVYGEGVYEFTLETRKETPEGLDKHYYKLAINAGIRPSSENTKLLGIYSPEMPDMLTYKIDDYDNGGGKVTITMTSNADLADISSKNGIELEKTGANTSDDTNSEKLKKIFIVDKTVKKLSLNKGQLTITAENGHTDTYEVVLKHEDIFSKFALNTKTASYEGKVFNDDPQKIVVDLPYDFYTDTDYADGAPNPAYKTIEDAIESLIATWTTEREETFVEIGSAYTGLAANEAESGEETLGFANVTTAYTADKDNYPNINEKNGNNQDNYLIYSSKTTVDNADLEGTTPATTKSTKGIFADTKSRKVDSFNDGVGTNEHVHDGEVEIIVRIPLYNPEANLTGIQIKGVNPDGDNVVENKQDYTGTGADNTKQGSETWSQYIPVNKDNSAINITVPKDVLQESASAKKDEVGNSRAFIKLWGSYGSVIEIPWDFVDNSGSNTDMESNGFDTDGNKDNALVGSAKTECITTSDSTILLTEKNNSTTPNVKTVRIAVKSQDGNKTVNYDLQVRELADERHATELQSVEIYSGTTKIGTGVKNSADDDWTVQLTYAIGSGDDGIGIPDGYTVKAVAQDGGRISYKPDKKAGPDDAASTASEFTALIRTANLASVLPTPGPNIAEELTAEESRVQPKNNHQFTLRVWDNDDITDTEVYKDHTITLTMPTPSKEMRISDNGATVSVDKIPNIIAGYPFETKVDNTKNEITVDLPYEYRNVDEVYFSKLTTDGIGARVFWDNNGTLTQVGSNSVPNATRVLTGANGVNWKKGETISLYVFSEESYTRLKHKVVGGGSVGSGTVDTIAKIDALTDGDNYVYYRKYTMKCNELPGQRLNTLEDSIKADDDLDMIEIKVDNANNIINITVPNTYVNSTPKYTTVPGVAAAEHTFTLDFKTDGDKARLYMGAVNDNTNDVTPAAANVQALNNGIPAGGIKEYIAATVSQAIVPKDTVFWVNKETDANGKDIYVLRYSYSSTRDGSTDVKTNIEGRLAKEAIVAAEYSQWDPTLQENGGTRPYRINVKVADPETDPSIFDLKVGGVTASLREVVEEGIATYTVALPADSDPHQPVEMTFTKKFTTAKLDGESYDKKAYYIVSKYAPVTIVTTSESGANKRYILKIAEGDVSSDTSLQSIRVDGYTAVRDGGTNNYYVSVGSNANLAAMSLTVTPNDSKATITVDSQSYTEGMTVSLDGKAVNITVTAENGDQTTYTLTAGEAPAGKPSDKITDLDQCSNSLRSEVAEAIDLGIVQGVGNNKFDPQRKVTRKEFAVMVARADIIAAGKASSTSAADDVLKTEYLAAGGKFTDVAGQSEIFRAAINYCSANEIINGTGDGTTFSPDGTITREQAATMLARWTNTTSGSTTNTTFSDWNDVSNWAKGAVNGVTSTDPAIMNGIGGSKFGPKGTVTREMAATLVKRVYVNYSSK